MNLHEVYCPAAFSQKTGCTDETSSNILKAYCHCFISLYFKSNVLEIKKDVKCITCILIIQCFQLADHKLKIKAMFFCAYTHLKLKVSKLDMTINPWFGPGGY